MTNLTDTARYLASVAVQGRTLYYSDMAKTLKLGSAQNCTAPLQSVMRWCNKNDLPDLSVIVVAKEDDLPSWHSENLHWEPEQIEREQRKVFSYHWSTVFRSLEDRPARVLSEEEIETIKDGLSHIIQEWVGFDIPSDGTEDAGTWDMMTENLESSRSLNDFFLFLQLTDWLDYALLLDVDELIDEDMLSIGNYEKSRGVIRKIFEDCYGVTEID